MLKKCKSSFLYLFIVLFLSFVLIACAAPADGTPTTGGNATDGSTEEDKATGEYQRISHEDAQARMDSGDDIIILDVRTPDEFSAGYIKGAINLPVNQIRNKAAEILPDKDAEILIYCRSGNRSKTASLELLSLGYTNVFDFGGIMGWPGDIEKP